MIANSETFFRTLHNSLLECQYCGHEYDALFITVLGSSGMGSTGKIRCKKCHNILPQFNTRDYGVPNQKFYNSVDTFNTSRHWTVSCVNRPLWAI
jgi:hypothetical protein